MRLCIFTHQYLPRGGGVQTLIESFVKYLVEVRKFEIIIIAPYYGDMEPCVEEQGNLKIYRVFNPDKKWTLPLGLLRMVRIIKARKTRLGSWPRCCYRWWFLFYS